MGIDVERMPLRQLGDSDLRVSVVGLGTNNFGRRLDEAKTAAVVHAALDAGINFIDTANIYGGGDSERFLGSALKGRRDEALVATKFGMPMPGEADDVSRGRPEYVRRAMDESLQRLGVDHVDLYQLHQPDPSTPIEETLGALHDLVKAGKTRAIGCSNFDGAQLRAADSKARELGVSRFVSVQNQYSWLRREAEQDAIPVALELGLGFIPYFPLASGLLTGKYRRGEVPPPGARLSTSMNSEAFLNDPNIEKVEALREWAEEHGCSLLDIAIGGLAAMPGVASVIAGAMTPEQVRANAQAGSWRPSEAELEELRRPA